MTIVDVVCMTIVFIRSGFHHIASEEPLLFGYVD